MIKSVGPESQACPVLLGVLYDPVCLKLWSIDSSFLFEYLRTMKEHDLAKIFKALSNEQRLRIFRMLCEWQDAGESERLEEVCCGVEKGFTRACCSISLSRSTISHHFKELQAAGLITVTRSGQSFVCAINPEAVEAIRCFLQQLPDTVVSLPA